MATSAEKQPGCAASFDRGPGVYVLRVMTEHHDDNSYALNKYALRVSATSGAQPTLSGITDMSIFANDVLGGKSTFHLAKVEQKYAGKDLVVEFWDAGDFGGNPSSGDKVRVLDGTGTAPANCTWEVEDNDFIVEDSGTGCTFDMKSGTSSAYDNKLVRFTIPIPDAYSCSGDGCWFKVFYDYSGGTSIRDVTTWRAYIDGNPIRIIE